MKKRHILLISAVFFLLAIISVAFTKKSIKPDSIHLQNLPTIGGTHMFVDANSASKKKITPLQRNDTVPSNWKTYFNTTLGFTFQYPSTWSKYGEDSKMTDASGRPILVTVSFMDAVSHTTFLIKYHLAPNGLERYQTVLSQFDSSKGLYEKDRRQTEVAGHKAIEGFATITTDGKDHPLDPPDRLILVDFLDKQKTGEIEIQLRTPLPNNDSEVANLIQILSTFKFAN